MQRLFLVFPVSMLLFSVVADAAAAADAIKWHTSLSQASKATRVTKRPMLLFITMQGCGYCTQMKQHTYQNADVVSQISDSYVAAQIDGLKHRRISHKIGVRIFPTTAIVSPDGKLMDVIHGYASSQDILQRLRVASRKHTTRLAKVPQESSK